MACENCYSVEIPECPASLLVKAGLEASKTYYVTITDKFGEKYNQQVTTDINGSYMIDVSGFQAGSFNRHSGNWTIEVRKLLANCEPELMQFCDSGTAENYSCISMSFRQSSLGSLATEIGCICNDPINPQPPTPGSNNSQDFPFTNQTTVTCVHNLGRYADVTIYNALGVEIQGQITQPNLNTVIVSFNSSQSGTVHID